jgi:hypothetical protein
MLCKMRNCRAQVIDTATVLTLCTWFRYKERSEVAGSWILFCPADQIGADHCPRHDGANFPNIFNESKTSTSPCWQGSAPCFVVGIDLC